MPLVTYFFRYVLRIHDPTGALPVGLLGGILGVLAAGLFADGLMGQGWNGVGLDSYLGIEGQGVTGLLSAPGLAADWPGQLNAQIVGLAATAGLTAALAGLLFLVFKVLLVLWHLVPAPDPEEEGETLTL